MQPGKSARQRPAGRRHDRRTQLDAHVTQQASSVGDVLRSYFDPRDGRAVERLDAFVRDDGEIARRLDTTLGAEREKLAALLAQRVGEQSVLLRKLDPAHAESVVAELRRSMDAALAAQREHTRALLDPLAKDGPIARFLAALQHVGKGSKAVERLLDKGRRVLKALQVEPTPDRGEEPIVAPREEVKRLGKGRKPLLALPPAAE